MNDIDALLRAYERHIGIPWPADVAGPQRVWFLIYDPSQERRLRLRLGAFEAATRSAGYDWKAVDLTDAFAQWMSEHDYRESYFAEPEAMELALLDFSEAVAQRVEAALTGDDAGGQTVVVLTGLSALFGLTRVSDLIVRVAPSIRGRLLAFFPGTHHGSNYRLLDARDGWNYLAVPISAGARGG